MMKQITASILVALMVTTSVRAEEIINDITIQNDTRQEVVQQEEITVHTEERPADINDTNTEEQLVSFSISEDDVVNDIIENQDEIVIPLQESNSPSARVAGVVPCVSPVTLSIAPDPAFAFSWYYNGTLVADPASAVVVDDGDSATDEIAPLFVDSWVDAYTFALAQGETGVVVYVQAMTAQILQVFVVDVADPTRDMSAFASSFMLSGGAFATPLTFFSPVNAIVDYTIDPCVACDTPVVDPAVFTVTADQVVFDEGVTVSTILTPTPGNPNFSFTGTVMFSMPSMPVSADVVTALGGSGSFQPAPGTYTIVFTAIVDGCIVATDSITITITDIPDVACDATTTPVIIINAPTTTFAEGVLVETVLASISATATLGGVDVSSSMVITHPFDGLTSLAPGTYTSTYTSTSASGCLTTQSLTITVTGTTGGGGGSKKRNNTTQGEVLGDSTCGPYLATTLVIGYKNDPEEVKKLQTFLNDTMSEVLVVDGIFGIKTKNAVIRYQKQVASTDPQGVVGDMTRYFVNKAMCPELGLVLPVQVLWRSDAPTQEKAHVATSAPVVTIPSIGVNETIKIGGTFEKAGDRVWQSPFSAGFANGGNTTLVGHRYQNIVGRTSDGAPVKGDARPAVFYALTDVRAGDMIYVKDGTQVYAYLVTDAFIARASDVWIEAPTETPTLTLYTCTPYMTSTHRAVVRATLQSVTPSN